MCVTVSQCDLQFMSAVVSVCVRDSQCHLSQTTALKIIISVNTSTHAHLREHQSLCSVCVCMCMCADTDEVNEMTCLLQLLSLGVMEGLSKWLLTQTNTHTQTHLESEERTRNL